MSATLSDSEHARAILHTIGEGVVTVDATQRVVFANAAAERLFGFRAGEMEGITIERLMPSEYAHVHGEAFQHYLARSPCSQPCRHVQVEGLRSDGTRFPLGLRFSSLRLDQRVLVTAACRDLSAELQAERERERREELNRLVLEISARFINLDPLAIDGAIHEALERCGRALGIERAFVFSTPTELDTSVSPARFEWCDEAVPASRWSLGPSEDEPVSEAVKSWFRERALRSETIRIDDVDKLGDGPGEQAVRERLRAEGIRAALVVPVRTEGRHVGLLGFDTLAGPVVWSHELVATVEVLGHVFAGAMARQRGALALRAAQAELEQKVADRTRELRAQQAKLLQSEKLASLGQLVAGVAHEVNTPLGAIVSNNDTLERALSRVRDELERPEPDRTRLAKWLDGAARVIAVTKDASARISAIVRSLRTFARLDQAEVDTIDVARSLDETLAVVEHLLRGRVQVRREYRATRLVECHPNQLNQVFMNLIVNASQALESDGTITIRTSDRDDNDRAGVLIEVEDDGAGIAPEHLARVFDPGFTTKGVGVGTGLGLSIVHQVIEVHGGSVRLESPAPAVGEAVGGRGTLASVWLPQRLPPRISS